MLRQAPWSVLRLCRPHSHMRIQVCEIHPSLGDCELVDDLVTWIIENHERRRVNAHKLENRKWLQECFSFRHPIWRIFFRWVVQPSLEFASQPHFTCFLNLSGLCWHRQRSGCLSSLIDLWDLQFGVHVLYLRPSSWASQDMCCCHVAPSLGLWVSGEPCFHLWKDSPLSLYLGAAICQQDTCTEMAFVSNVHECFCHMTGNQLLLQLFQWCDIHRHWHITRTFCSHEWWPWWWQDAYFASILIPLH